MDQGLNVVTCALTYAFWCVKLSSPLLVWYVKAYSCLPGRMLKGYRWNADAVMRCLCVRSQMKHVSSFWIMFQYYVDHLHYSFLWLFNCKSRISWMIVLTDGQPTKWTNKKQNVLISAPTKANRGSNKSWKMQLCNNQWNVGMKNVHIIFSIETTYSETFLGWSLIYPNIFKLNNFWMSCLSFMYVDLDLF